MNDELEGKERDPPPLSKPTRRKAAGASLWSCKCCCYTVLALLLAVFGVVTFMFVGQVFKQLADPHHALVLPVKSGNTGVSGADKASATGASAPKFSVRPFINREQTFDVAVSVWLRESVPEPQPIETAPPSAPAESESAGKRDISLDVDFNSTTQVEVSSADALVSADSEDPGGLLSMMSDLDKIMSRNITLPNEPERLLFSTIAYRGLKMSDKNKLANVSFPLPLSWFYGENISTFDLRGSFVLLPSSPSPLENVVNFSSWRPPQAPGKPNRFWPSGFSDGQEAGSSVESPPTLSDQVLDSFGFSVPLIEMQQEPPLDCAADGNEDEVEGTYEPQFDEDGNPLPSAAPSLNTHPYIVTRTQIRIVDDDRPLDLVEYNKKHLELRRTSCRPFGPRSQPHSAFCARSYQTNGYWETRLELGVPVIDSKGQKTARNRTEWAYAPFWNYLTNSAGPADFVRVPVTRKVCNGSRISHNAQPSHGDKDTIDITWNLAFSGRSPGKLILADTFVQSIRMPHPHNATDFALAHAQNTHELWSGLLGHRLNDDAHPRRRVVVEVLEWSLQMIRYVFDTHYWITLSSTVGISIPGTLLGVAEFILSTIYGVLQADSLPEKIFTLIFLSFFALGKVAAAKAVLRIEIQWRGWSPSLVRVRPNHSERASMRLDAQTSIMTKVLIFGAVAVFTYITLGIHDPHLLSPGIVPTTGVDIPKEVEWSFLAALMQALDHTSLILQILLNHYAQTFAGAYKTTYVLLFAELVLRIMLLIPSLVGAYATTSGIQLSAVFYNILGLTLFWQAMTLPKPSPSSMDEE